MAENTAIAYSAAGTWFSTDSNRDTPETAYSQIEMNSLIITVHLFVHISQH